MNETFRPDNPEQLRDLLAWAASEDKRIEIVGTGSKRAVGRPMAVDHVVALGGMAGISLYEPDELVMTASPATPIAEIEAALSENNQQLEFEPPDYGPLLASVNAGQGGSGTLSNAP
ncbi:MAG: FAD-binding protein, partial [Proteobacteria bacterium]|nr:FAD-binding protein [Pseudomonadota bacterium]